MHVVEMTDVAIGGIDRRRDVDAEDLGAFRGRSFGEASSAHPGVEQSTAGVLVVTPTGRGTERRVGRGPTVDRVHLHGSKPLPLEGKALRVRLRAHESRNPGGDRIRGTA